MEWRPMRNAFVAGYYCVTLSTGRIAIISMNPPLADYLPSNGKKHWSSYFIANHYKW